MLNYGRADLTAKCACSLMAQDYPRLDIVVVDNYSSAEECSRLQGLLPAGVRLVLSGRNVGYAAGNNLGVNYRGLPMPAYFLIVNSDVTMSDHGTVRALYEALVSRPGIAACSPLIHDPSATRQLDAARTVQVRRLPDFKTTLIVNSWFLSRIFRRISDRYIYRDLMPFAGDAVIEVDTINGACFLVSGEVLAALGGLDSGTFLYYEEIILGSQLRSLGMHCALVTSVTASHLQGSSSTETAGKFVLRRRLQSVRSEIYWCRRYLRVGRLGIALVYLLRSADISSKFLLRFLQFKKR